VTATIEASDGGYVAECLEYDVRGEGADREAALSALREALFERAIRPQAVAPPSHPDDEAIEIVVVPIVGRDT
jgi:hypothetical protein